jgi:hypothetical protein
VVHCLFAPDGGRAVGSSQSRGLDVVQVMREAFRDGNLDGVQHVGAVGRSIDQRVGEQQPVRKLGHFAGALAGLVKLYQRGGEHVDIDHTAVDLVELDHVANLVGLHQGHIQVTVNAHDKLFADDQQGTRHRRDRQRKTRDRGRPDRQDDQQRRKPDDVARPDQMEAALLRRNRAPRQITRPEVRREQGHADQQGRDNDLFPLTGNQGGQAFKQGHRAPSVRQSHSGMAKVGNRKSVSPEGGSGRALGVRTAKPRQTRPP